MHQPRLTVGTDMGFGTEVVLVALLDLVHFRVVLAVLVLGRIGRMNQHRVDDGALAQRQARMVLGMQSHAVSIRYRAKPEPR